MELFLWHYFRYFVLIFLIQTLFYFLRTFARKENLWPSPPGNEELSSVLSKQQHTVIEKIVFCTFQLFAKQWNHYNICSFHRTPRDGKLSSSVSSFPSFPSSVHKIEVTVETKYLLVGYHSRPVLDLFYLVTNFECSIFVIHILFYLPAMRKLLPLFGLIPAKDVSFNANRSNEDYFIEALLSSSRPILLLPGGAMECLKDFSDLYELQWKKEMGFARIIRNYYLKEQQEQQEQQQNSYGKKKKMVRIKIIPFYTSHCEFLFFSTSSWYTGLGRTIKNLMNHFQESYLKNIALLPVILLTLLFSFGFFLLPLPLPVTTFFGPEIEYHCNNTELDNNNNTMNDTNKNKSNNNNNNTLNDNSIQSEEDNKEEMKKRVSEANETTEQFTERIRTELEKLIDRVNDISLMINNNNNNNNNNDNDNLNSNSNNNTINDALSVISNNSRPEKEEMTNTVADEERRVVERDKNKKKKKPKRIPSFEELFFQHSLFYSRSSSVAEKIYLLFLGFFSLLGNGLFQLMGILSLLLMTVLLKLLTPLFVHFSGNIMKTHKKQKIS
jgi:hypothetical protein